jgi:hypothetical protein
MPSARIVRLFAALAFSAAAGGCAVVAVVDTAATVAVKGVGLAADAAVGTVRLTGKAVGAVADAALPSSED